MLIPQSRDAKHSRASEDQYMTNRSDTRQFKESQLFDWAMEPAEERRSVFGRSTDFTALSRYREMPRKRKPNHLLLAAGVITGICIVALSGMAQLLRG